MTDITKTKSQVQGLKPQQDKLVQKVAAKKKGEAPSDKKALNAVKQDIETKRLDFLLSTRNESENVFFRQNKFQERADAQRVNFKQLQHEDMPTIAEITPEEASDLVAEDGYFGVAKTSQRLADFVIKGGGSDLKMLQAGREGIIKGFKEAEKLWGDKLPEICSRTLDRALEMIDSHIQELGGGAVVDIQA